MGSIMEHFEHETPVVVVGAGAVGLLTAFQLARLGVPSIVAEQNLDINKSSKTETLNDRSMDIFRMMGIADDFRAMIDTLGSQERGDGWEITVCPQSLNRVPLCL